MNNATDTAPAASLTVRAAIVRSCERHADYFARCLSTRSSGCAERAGSWYDMRPLGIEVALRAAEWEAYPHEAIKAPAIGYRAPIAGKLGMIGLDALPADAVIELLDPKGGEAFWDGKQKVSPSVRAADYGLEAPAVGFTTAILGPDPDGELVVWTFHPGEPCAPSDCDRIAADGSDRHGQRVTVEEARALGFGMVKLT